MDWGTPGAIGPGCDVAVIIDVLSFTTTLTVAVDRGTVVFPYRWHDDTAEGFAAERDATLAVGRSRAVRGQVSLSPLSVLSHEHHPAT
jgi:2-phosphosulfolactate phosphatase